MLGWTFLRKLKSFFLTHCVPLVLAPAGNWILGIFPKRWLAYHSILYTFPPHRIIYKKHAHIELNGFNHFLRVLCIIGKLSKDPYK